MPRGIKTPFYQKKYSTGKPVQYAKGHELQINPVKFHSNCISGIREVVRTNFKKKLLKGRNSDKNH
jgi:hypothetical protein